MHGSSSPWEKAVQTHIHCHSIAAHTGRLGQLFLQMHSWITAPVHLLGSEADSVYEKQRGFDS